MIYDFEDFLEEIHAKQYTGTDDDMPDNFEHWLETIGIDAVITYANQYAKQCVERSETVTINKV